MPRPQPHLLRSPQVPGGVRHVPARSSARRVRSAVQTTSTAKTQTPELSLLQWLKDNGAEQHNVGLKTMEVPAAGESGEGGELGQAREQLVRAGSPAAGAHKQQSEDTQQQHAQQRRPH